jgi:hypothetical protein
MYTVGFLGDYKNENYNDFKLKINESTGLD